MKAATLYQPYATLIAIRAKRVETRSWSTRYRGPLAIHASRTWQREARLLLNREPFFSVLYKAGYVYKEVHALGAIIAIVDLKSCLPIYHEGPLPISDQERTFGDYTLGRFMWFLGNIRELKHPIPAKGALGLWDWTPPLDLEFK